MTTTTRNISFDQEDIWRQGGEDTFEYKEFDSSLNEIGTLLGITGGIISRNALSELKTEGKINYAYNITHGWIDKYVRVYMVRRPFIDPSIVARELLGTFITTTPSYTLKNDGSVSSSIDMYSLLLRLKRIKTRSNWTVPAGANIVQTVVNMCEQAGLQARYEPSDLVLLNDRTFEVDKNYVEVANELLSIANYSSIDVDVYGNALIQPYIDPNNRAPAWVFSDDEKGVYLPEIKVEWDSFDTPNRITVHSEDFELGSNSVTVENNDPDDPFSIPNRGIIDKVYTLDHLETNEQLAVKANNYMARNRLGVEAYSFSHLYVPIMHNDTVQFNNNRLGISQLVSIHTMDIQLTPGTLCKDRVRWFKNA